MAIERSNVVTKSTQKLANAWLGDVPALAEELMAAIFTDNPEWTDYSPVPRDDLWDGCRRYLTRVLQILSGTVAGPHRDDVAAGIGQQRAEQGVPLEVMLRTFRLGGRVVWEALLAQARTDDVEPDVVLDAATAIWTVIDGLSSTLSTAYRNTELEHLRRDDQRRHALIEDLLRGRARDTAFAKRMGNELDLPVDGNYLVIVAETRADGSATLGKPQATLEAMHIRSVWQFRADTVVGLVALEHRDSAQTLAKLRPLARGRAAASPIIQGLAEIELGHELALTALGTVPTGAIELVSLDQRYSAALLSQQPELTSRLVKARLGPVLNRPEKERDVLLETLTAWLEENCSAANAATRLYCHRNTVLNRLQRIATLTEQPLHGRKAYVDLSLALSALNLPNTETR